MTEGGGQHRFLLSEAEEYGQPLLEYLKNAKGVKNAEIAGNYRRNKETVGDIDILVTAKRGSEAMDKFVEYDEVDEVVAKGKTKSTVILRSGFQIDLRVVPAVSYGAALYYFTGSKAHNVAVRKKAVAKGLKVNEYGVFKDDERIAGKTEKEVFKSVELPYIIPELRENRGEIEAAVNGELPKLVELKDIRGDLQTHTKASDGKYSLEEMVDAAREIGYEYYAVTDHSQKVSVAGGLDEKRLRKQIEEIDKLNEKLDDILILKSIEVDILKDGKLDLSDDVLKELDLTICSIHYNLNLPEKEQTERILKAMDNRYFNILAHPTGRRLGEREAYRIDIEKVLKKAKENNCFLEVNADPERLDLNDVHCKMAKDAGVKLSISTDAHTISSLYNMKYGVAQARRGWLEVKDVLNARSWKELKKLLKKG